MLQIYDVVIIGGGQRITIPILSPKPETVTESETLRGIPPLRLSPQEQRQKMCI